MIFEGDKSVIDAIKEKKRLRDAGAPHGHIKPVVFVDGGLMKGSYGVGAGLALEELGHTNSFSSVVGVSSGAPSAAYFVSGEVARGASLVWEECCSRKFINPWRFWNQVDTDYFKSVLENGPKAIEIDKVFDSATKLYIAVSDFQTAEPHLLKPQNSAELYSAIQASILMPNVSTDIVEFNDIRYVDGGFTRPHALWPTIDQIEMTHLLIITNQDKGDLGLGIETWLNKTIYRWRMPKPLRFAALERRKERIKALNHLASDHPIPHALVWGDNSIKSFERDSNKVKAVVEKSRLWWRELLI